MTLSVYLRSRLNVNDPDAEGRTALHLACGADAERVDVVTALLAAGAARNVLDKAGKLPVHHAAGAGHAGILRVLLQFGGNTAVHAVDLFQNTVLHYAVKCRSPTCVQVRGHDWSLAG